MWTTLKIIGRPSRDDPNKVGPLQEAILRRIASCPAEAHGIGIARALRNEHPDLPDAQVYVALRRLEARGIIELAALDTNSTHTPSSSKGRKGRPRKFYALTGSGKRAITGAAEPHSKSAPVMTEGCFYGRNYSTGDPA